MITLSTPSGDGSLQVSVDGFGSFGSSVNGETSDAFYDPIGDSEAAGTVFASSLALRVGDDGDRTYLTTGSILEFEPSQLDEPDLLRQDQTSADSTFEIEGLDFALNQGIAQLLADDGTVVGSTLVQTYEITNTTDQTVEFELIRYLDGDLEFDGTSADEDAGGRLVQDNPDIDPENQQEILFETDSVTDAESSADFVGISATGGSTEGPGRFQIGQFTSVPFRFVVADLRTGIADGTPLNDSIREDGPDEDEFIDGSPFDVALALNNTFVLEPGESTVYSTRTLFGSAAPAAVINEPTEVEFSQPEYQFAEDDLASEITIELNRTGDTSLGSTVQIQLNNGTATGGASGTTARDFDNTPISVSFGPGQTRATVTLPLNDDEIDEPREVFSLSLGSNSGVALGVQDTATVEILDDDQPAPEVARVEFSEAEYQFNENAPNLAVVTLRRTGDTRQVSTVEVQFADGTATGGATIADGVDFDNDPITVEFEPGQTSETVTIPINNDEINEPDETFNITLESNDSGTEIGSQASATVEILASDEPTPIPAPPPTPNPAPIPISSSAPIPSFTSLINLPPFIENLIQTIDSTDTESPVPIELTGIDIGGNISFFTITDTPDPSEGTLFFSGVPVTDPEQVAEILPEQVDQLSFVPAAGFVGDASFSYTATDNDGAESSTSRITVTVQDPNLLSRDEDTEDLGEDLRLIEEDCDCPPLPEIPEVSGAASSDLTLSNELVGTDLDDAITALEGNDLIFGSDGNDLLISNVDNDTLSGGEGNDTLHSGQGDDLVVGDQGDDLLFGDLGNDHLCGDAGNDTLFGDQVFDNAQLGLESDILSGGTGNDLLFANIGDDKLAGNEGEDTLFSGQGNDTLFGGDGADVLSGDDGNDLISGGAGNDLFVIFIDDGLDTIDDFQLGVDQIALGGGLTFEQLTFTQQGTSTIIGVEATDESIVVLRNVEASTLTSGQFTTFTA